ncbi:MAG: CHAT domain-containing protein [Bryobacter sp.]|nr:CHAT domain-containing protein [Bryobacter sp.]
MPRRAFPRWGWLLAALLLWVGAVAFYFTLGQPKTSAVPVEQGVSLLRNGAFAEARTLALKMLETAEGESAWAWRTVAAEAWLEEGKAEEASKLLEGAAGGAPIDFVVRGNILRARMALGKADSAQALRLLAEAGASAKQAGREDLALEVLLIEAQAEARRGQFPVAETKFRTALDMAKAAKEAYREGMAQNGLGMLRLIRSQFDEAIPYFEAANRAYGQAGSRHGQAVAANNLGLCYTQLGDFERARQLREEVLRTAAPGPLRANALGEAGTLAYLQQQTAEAARLYREARDMAKQASALPDAARWASNLTAALISLGDWDGAAAALAEALSLKPEPRSKVFLDLNAAAIALGQGKAAAAREQYEAILASQPEQVTARWQAEAGLANVYAVEKDIPAARQHYEAALAIIEAGQSDLNRNEHKLTFLARLIRVYQDYVEFLITQGDGEKALAVAESSRARLLAERLSRPAAAAGKEEWRKRKNVVWLAYWLADRRSLLWIVAGGKVRMVELPPATELAKWVEEYRAFIETSLRDPMLTPSEAGKKLYENLIQPAAAELAAQPRAIVVPDGALHQLSFETLPNYAVLPTRYWGDEATVAIAPALSATADLDAKLPPSPPALLFGDPVVVQREYPALPAAAAELDAVAQYVAPEQSLVKRGAEATPDAYFAAPLERFRLLHFAAHAEANRQSPLDSALILSRGKGYRLAAREILARPLGAELVTLSACRSSGARVYAGEGQVGLAWAFLGAGAKAAIAGLWDVADQSTAVLMRAFYQQLQAGQPPAVALRRAKAELRQQGYGKPFYWGPFQCYLR